MTAPIIEPHIHMYSRTTDDYQSMYSAGIRACVEPSFWLGVQRRYAGTFFDYFNVILEFETVRARRFGIDHYCCISVNPKESEDNALVDEVLAGIEPYILHKRCVAIGEIGFNNLTANEERSFKLQLRLAKKYDMPVLVHLPHTSKLEGAKRSVAIIKEEGMDVNKVLIDHNTEETMPVVMPLGCYAGLTVYPISKLTPERASGIIREFGSSRVFINSSADWGISDPITLPKIVNYLAEKGHSREVIEDVTFRNANAFFSGSRNWRPELNLQPVDPREFQR